MGSGTGPPSQTAICFKCKMAAAFVRDKMLKASGRFLLACSKVREEQTEPRWLNASNAL